MSNEKQTPETHVSQPLNMADVSGSIFLQCGMRVKIKNDKKNHPLYYGKIKTITSDLPNFGSKRAFGLDGDTGIWCIEDFEYCVN